MRLNSEREFEKFEKDSLNLSLQNSSPRKGEEFFLFRGTKKPFELLSSIQVDLKERAKNADWQKLIRVRERELLNKFLDEIEPFFPELIRQYGWFCPPRPRTDTFWYLSVMQHFRAPTRLCDFTADFWMAIFFAVDCSNGSEDLGFYRLRCKNCEKAGNKLPRDRNGRAWSQIKSEGETVYDMNEFLGYLIEYNDLHPTENYRERLSGFFHSEKEFNSYGWDKPHFENARLHKQKGFFVYNVDITKPLESDLRNDTKNFEKYALAQELYPYLKRRLDEKEFVRWKVYLDLEKAFEDFHFAAT